MLKITENKKRQSLFNKTLQMAGSDKTTAKWFSADFHFQWKEKCNL